MTQLNYKMYKESKIKLQHSHLLRKCANKTIISSYRHCGEIKKKMFAVALDPIQQKLGAECPFPAKMVDWAQNKVVINNINMSIVNIINISVYHELINLILFSTSISP